MNLLQYELPREYRALERKYVELEGRVTRPCVLDRQDRKKKICDMDLKIDRLKAHPEHWHVTELRAAIENLRKWMIEARRGGMSWSMKENTAVGEDCEDCEEELSDLNFLGRG